MMNAATLLLGLITQTAAPQQPPPGTHDLLVLRWAGPEALLVHPKDQGLLAALGLVGERLAELPAELGGPLLPDEAGELLARVLGGPLDLRVGLFGRPTIGAPPPVSVQLALPESSAEGALAVAERVRSLAGFAGLASSPAAGGLLELAAPVPILFGARGDDFVLALNRVDDTPIDLGATRLPPDVEAAVHLRFDYGALMELVTGMAPPQELGPMRGLLEAFGTMRIEWEMGVDAERTHSVVTVPGYVDTMNELGLMPAAPISEQSLAAVPADATWATLGAASFTGAADLFLGMLEEADLPQDPLEMLAQQTGLHLKDDVLAHLGSTWGAYASDSTGGGGLLSMVLLLELADPQAFARTKERIEELIDSAGLAQAEGYVRVRGWESDGVSFSSIVFPGLPVPLEPTCSVAAGHLFIALTPQAALGAVRQATAGASDLRDNPRFQEQFFGSGADLYALAFLDTPRLMRDGYGPTSLFCSALTNGTRSRRDGARDAGRILPPFAELARGAKGVVSAARLEGGDLVQFEHADGSMLVNAAGTLGFLGSGPVLLFAAPGLLATFVVPKVVQARSATPKGKARADIMAINNALNEYAALNRGRYPDTLEALVTPDENGYTFLDRRSVPRDPWGNEYLYEPPSYDQVQPRVYSLGADGRIDGQGEDADIDNWTIIDGDA